MNLERSLAFTALLDLSPEFAAMDVGQAEKVITQFLRDYNDQPVTASLPTMYEYAKTWLANQPDGLREVAER